MMENFDDEEVIVDDAPDIWTRYDIRTGQGRPKPVLVEWSTNDDNDDGYDDGEVTRDEYRFDTIDAAISFTGRTRIGLYGQPVTVTLDGIELRQGGTNG